MAGALAANDASARNVIVTTAEWAPAVLEATFEYAPIPAALAAPDPWSCWTDHQFVLDSIAADIDLIDEFQPDVVVHDARWSVPVAAISRRTRVITLMQTNMFPGFAFSGRTNELWERPVSAFNSALRRYAQPALRSDVRELFLRTRMLVPSVPGFDLVPETYRGQVMEIGPLVHPGSGEAATDTETADLRTIYVYGVITTQEELITLLRVADSRGLRVILPLLPERLCIPSWADPVVMSTRYVDVKSVLPRCGLAIIHGGHGSCQSVLTAGIPTLCLPTPGHDERTFNAGRLHVFGLAIVPDDPRPWEHLGELIDRAIQSNELRAAAAAIRMRRTEVVSL